MRDVRFYLFRAAVTRSQTLKSPASSASSSSTLSIPPQIKKPTRKRTYDLSAHDGDVNVAQQYDTVCQVAGSILWFLHCSNSLTSIPDLNRLIEKGTREQLLSLWNDQILTPRDVPRVDQRILMTLRTGATARTQDIFANMIVPCYLSHDKHKKFKLSISNNQFMNEASDACVHDINSRNYSMKTLKENIDANGIAIIEIPLNTQIDRENAYDITEGSRDMLTNDENIKSILMNPSRQLGGQVG